MSLVINLLGGPGTGKSTLAAEIFVILKKKGISCEYITEYAKDKTWEKSMTTLENQIYVFGKQHHKMFRVNGKVDVMITDSSLLLSIIYGGLKKEDTFYKLIIEEFNKFDNLNFFIERKTEYDPVGRNQTEEEAVEIDKQIEKILIDNDIECRIYNKNGYGFKSAEQIAEKIIDKLNE